MLRPMARRVLIAEADAAVAAHLERQLVAEGYDVGVVTSSSDVIGALLTDDVDVVVLDLPDTLAVLDRLLEVEFAGGVVVVDVPTGPDEVTSTGLDEASQGRPVLLLHHLDHLPSAVEQVLELVGGTDGREELDVAAVVAVAIATHAPGTHMEGPSSGGVQVIRATLDPAAFDALLLAVAELVGVGSRVQLEHDGGRVRVIVGGARADEAGLDRVRAALVPLGGTLTLDGPGGDAFSVAVPSGLSAWE